MTLWGEYIHALPKFPRSFAVTPLDQTSLYPHAINWLSVTTDDFAFFRVVEFYTNRVPYYVVYTGVMASFTQHNCS
jgi:hypothetical protein